MVNPIIQPAKLVVVVPKEAKNPKSGSVERYTHPKRQPISLKTSAAFDGTATLTCDKPGLVRFFTSKTGGTEIKFDGKGNVFKGASLASGVELHAEAAAPSGAMDDIGLKLSLSGGSNPKGPDATATATSVELGLDICKSRPGASAEPPPLSADDKAFVGRNLLVQNSSGAFERAQLVLRQVKPAAFKGELELRPVGGGQVTAFRAEKKKKTAGEAPVLPFVIAADKIPAAGEKLWAEASKPSAHMADAGFVLTVKDTGDEGDKVVATAVKLTLDLCQSRTKKLDPATPKDRPPLSEEKKVKEGRFVHEQDAGNHHGRALLVVRKIEPAKFDGTLSLQGVNDAKVELFPNERPTAGEAATALPHEFDSKAEGNDDKKLWVQGKAVSGALRDITLSLRLKEDPPSNVDQVNVTVCKFSDLKADIPSTPPAVPRAGNASPRHQHQVPGTTGDHWDFDDTNNRALVLIEDSVIALDPINLSVKVAPANVPVSWGAPRDSRAAVGDHHDVTILRTLTRPTQDAADPLKATLLTDGVGTFHIAPFVDCNGSTSFEPLVDLEPYLAMNLVLVRVEGKNNTSVRGVNAAIVPPAPTAATGCRVQTGGWTRPLAAAHSMATVKVIGGGADGRRGLD